MRIATIRCANIIAAECEKELCSETLEDDVVRCQDLTGIFFPQPWTKQTL